MPNYHLCILKESYLDAILEGRKKVESRFTITKRSPFGQIFAGDKIFLKLSSGPVRATAKVSAVKSFQNLTPRKIFEIKAKYNHLIMGNDEYWQSKSDCRFGLLVWLKDIKAIEPVRIDKKDWRAWVVLTKSENYGLLRNP